MQSLYQAPVAAALVPLTSSVSLSVSNVSAGYPAGGFRGLFFNASSSVTIVCVNGVSVPINDVRANSLLWIQFAYVSVVSTATAGVVYGVL